MILMIREMMNGVMMKDECQHMMTRIKLNYYRAEEEMLIMERIRWRRETEERTRLWKKTEKELGKLRVQEFIIIFYFLTSHILTSQFRLYIASHYKRDQNYHFPFIIFHLKNGSDFHQLFHLLTKTGL